MKKLFFTFLLYFICSSGISQVLQDLSGKPYINPSNTDLLGSPFIFDEWRLAKIKLKSQQEIDNVKVKFNPFNNSFYYNKNDSLYEFLDKLEEVRVKDPKHLTESGYDMVFANNITAGNNIIPGTFVQVLCKGKVTLVKYFKGKIDENKESSTFGSEGKVKKLVTSSIVLAITSNGSERVQYNSKNLQALTADKTKLVNEFIKTKGLNIKKEMDFVVAVAYYNLLSP
jgi:hypothetical protein